MFETRATFNKDHEAIVQKFARLLERASQSMHEREKSQDGFISGVTYYEVRTSALNLLARTAGKSSIYYRELLKSRVNPSIMVGILTAAMTDFREGFMVDTKLLISAEVFADFLVQADVLLENDYKDAAAVIIRAVLEDGLRRVCSSKQIAVKERDGVHELADALVRQNVLTAVQFKEIQAKKEVGNKAAHGKFGEYTKADVTAFLEFAQRLLATLI
ncbi:MAG: DUF4145 domain-containing protein [Tepidisphaeraceae bacterium]|jgi:hypothetical protein